jgi:hypothetical protein
MVLIEYISSGFERACSQFLGGKKSAIEIDSSIWREEIGIRPTRQFGGKKSAIENLLVNLAGRTLLRPTSTDRMHSRLHPSSSTHPPKMMIDHIHNIQLSSIITSKFHSLASAAAVACNQVSWKYWFEVCYVVATARASCSPLPIQLWTRQ